MPANLKPETDTSKPNLAFQRSRIYDLLKEWGLFIDDAKHTELKRLLRDLAKTAVLDFIDQVKGKTGRFSPEVAKKVKDENITDMERMGITQEDIDSWIE